MPRQHMGNALALTQLRVQGVDGGTGHTKGLGDTFFFHHQHGGHGSFHFRHVVLLLF